MNQLVDNYLVVIEDKDGKWIRTERETLWHDARETFQRWQEGTDPDLKVALYQIIPLKSAYGTQER